MAYKTRRRIDVVLLLVIGAIVAGVAAIAAAVGDGERIERYWASASVGEVGPAAVTEVIDFDFGPSDRHGIFRDVPGLPADAPIVVDSPTAPDQFVVQPGAGAGGDTRIRIGDPNRTVDGRHRYTIEYPIDVAFDSRVSWNAVGTGWDVSISDVEIHLAMARRFEDVQCSTGGEGTWGGCTAAQPEPGHLVVTLDGLDANEGVTLSATAAAALAAAPTLPTPPLGSAADPGTGFVVPGLVALVAALAAGAVTSTLVRRAGRELVWAGGSADAAFGPQFGEQYPSRRVDHDELADLASTEFAPPKGLTAWQGGVLYAEHAVKDQQVAWLLERAIAGEIAIERTGDGDDDDLTLRLIEVDSAEHELLRGLFGGRASVTLGTYDKQFATGWDQLHDRLEDWHRHSPYWDPAGDRRRRRARIIGAALGLVGVALVAISAVAANRSGAIWLVPACLGAALAGTGAAMLVRSWELRVRTPAGSGLWILIESFRRFIRNSDAQHVEAAAKQGVLLDYTAWAVALGEVDRWSDAVQEADIDPSIAPQALYMTALAPQLSQATVSAATAPSSSGGGGGSVGGGGGGGGGGSW